MIFLLMKHFPEALPKLSPELEELLLKNMCEYYDIKYIPVQKKESKSLIARSNKNK